MFGTFLTPAGIAALCLHLALVGAALMLKGVALQQRSRWRKLLFAGVASLLAASALFLAVDWKERAILLCGAIWLAPVLFDAVVVRSQRATHVNARFETQKPNQRAV